MTNKQNLRKSRWLNERTNNKGNSLQSKHHFSVFTAAFCLIFIIYLKSIVYWISCCCPSCHLCLLHCYCCCHWPNDSRLRYLTMNRCAVAVRCMNVATTNIVSDVLLAVFDWIVPTIFHRCRCHACHPRCSDSHHNLSWTEWFVWSPSCVSHESLQTAFNLNRESELKSWNSKLIQVYNVWWHLHWPSNSRNCNISREFAPYRQSFDSAKCSAPPPHTVYISWSSFQWANSRSWPKMCAPCGFQLFATLQVNRSWDYLCDESLWAHSMWKTYTLKPFLRHLPEIWICYFCHFSLVWYSKYRPYFVQQGCNGIK